MSELTENVKFASNLAPKSIQGVLSGVAIMLVPLAMIGIAVGIGLLVVRTPINVLGGVK